MTSFVSKPKGIYMVPAINLTDNDDHTTLSIPHTCCRTWAQGVPVHEHAITRPQSLSLPTPGPREAYHHDCAKYRPIPGGGPADNPASHRGEVVYAGDCHVNHNHDERVPPREEHSPPHMGQRTRCTPTNLTHALLLCKLLSRRALHAMQRPKGHRLHY